MNCGIAQAPLMQTPSAYHRRPLNRWGQPYPSNYVVHPMAGRVNHIHSAHAPGLSRSTINIATGAPLLPSLAQDSDCVTQVDRQIFQRLSETSMTKKILAIAAIASGILMTLGAVFAWHALGALALAIGGICLLATGIASAVMAIKDEGQNAVLESSLGLSISLGV